MVNQNHPITMKEKEIEKEKENIMKMVGLSIPTIRLHDRFPFEIMTTAGSTLIPRTMVTNIIVGAITIDLHMNFHRHRVNNIQRDIRAIDGMSELHTAASSGNLEHVQAMVCRNRELLWLTESQERNLPLHLAVENGHKEVASYLIEEYPQGSYALNRSKISPLYLAFCSAKMLPIFFHACLACCCW